jgi:uncharacterized membrane protein
MSDMTPPPAPPTAPPAAPMGAGPSSNAKLIALLGWIFAPLGVIAIFLDEFKGDRFVRSHVIQAAALMLSVWVINAVLGATVILALLVLPLGLVLFIYQIYMAIQAFNGKSVEVPVIYGFVKQFIDQV